MSIEVYKIDESPTRSIYLLKDTNDNKYFPATANIVNPITLIGSGSGSFVWQGNWNTGTTYSGNDVVFYTGSSFISLQDSNLNNTPIGGSLYWELLAQGGSIGPSGLQGIQGPSGLQGPQGPQGIQGPSGAQGIQGDIGPSGAPGTGIGPDLAAIEALTGIGIYYRSAADTWSLVNIGSGLDFTSGILKSTGTGTVNINTGSMALQDAGNVFITGGSITNIIDLAVADGGTASSTASGARANLGLIIGSDIQAFNNDLAALSTLSQTGLFYRSSSGVWTLVNIGSGLEFKSGVLLSTGSSGIGAGIYQPLNNELTSISNASTTGLYFRSGAGNWSPVSIDNKLIFNNTGLLTTRMYGFADAEFDLGMSTGSTFSEYSGNHLAVENWISGSNLRYPIQFRGARFLFSEPISIRSNSSVRGGNRFIGTVGIQQLDQGLESSMVTTRFAWAGVTGFNGTTITATGTSGSRLIGLIGYTTKPTDVWQTLLLTGGTNFNTGWYHIRSVNTSGSNNWELDRCPNTADCSGMKGILKGTIIQDGGMGNEFENIYFRGTQTFAGTRTQTTSAAIGYHLKSDILAGKSKLDRCSFANLDVGILCGRGLARYNDRSCCYDGNADGNNMDHMYVGHVKFEAVDTCILIRGQQSVDHVFNKVECDIGCKTVLYVERGGRTTVNHISTSNGGDTTGPTILHIGQGSAYNGDPTDVDGLGGNTPEGPITIKSIDIDTGQSDTKILDMDDGGYNVGNVSIANLSVVNLSAASWKVPYVIVRRGWHAHLENIYFLTSGSILLAKGITSDDYFPSVTLISSVLSISDNDHPEVVLDLTNSTSGAQATFVGCIGAHRQFVKQGVFQCNGAGSGTWIY